MEVNQAITGLEQFKKDFKPFVGNPADWERVDAALKVLKGVSDTQHENDWISVKDRLPAETHSIFYPWFGKKQWNKAMWREQSDKVLVTMAFKDGTRIVTIGETHDGVWNTTISRTLEPVITHWMPLPEPQKEEHDAPTDRR